MMLQTRKRAYLITASLLIFLLSACGAGAKKTAQTEVSNPYITAAANFMHNGMAAMQKERWQAADRSFSRALSAAQLADHMPLMIQAWYNLGVTRASMQQHEDAIAAYKRCIALAARHGNSNMQMRATLALALVQTRAGTLPDDYKPEALSGSWPADIHLQAARLAQLHGKLDQATTAYQAVIAKNGSDSALLSLKGRAHMGLAMLAKGRGQLDQAREQAELALKYCRKTGMPRLTAHALLLQGQLPGAPVSRIDKLERAADIYAALKDLHGQKQSLMLLEQLAVEASDTQSQQRYQLRLRALDAKLGEQTH